MFLIIVDVWSYSNLSTLLLPNVNWAITMGLVTPLAYILSVESNIIISSKVNDVRAAQQLAGLIVLPLILVLLLRSAIPFIQPDMLALLIVGALAVADVAFFFST